MDTLPPHDKIDVIVLEKILSDRYLTLSYKLFWFKAVVDLVEMGEQEIPFRKIVYGYRVQIETWIFRQPVCNYRIYSQ